MKKRTNERKKEKKIKIKKIQIGVPSFLTLFKFAAISPMSLPDFPIVSTASKSRRRRTTSSEYFSKNEG